MSQPFARWSKSGLDKVVNGCSYAAYLEKVVGLPSPSGPQAALGTAYHAAIEFHERERLRALRDGAVFVLPGFDAVKWAGIIALEVELDGLPEDSLEKHGLTWHDSYEGLGTALDHWWSAPIPAGQPGAGGSLRDRVMRWRPVAVEPRFLAPIPEVSDRPLHGFIDVLYWDPDDGEYVTVDHKSVAHFKSWPVNGGGHELEATVYAIGAVIASGLPPEGVVRHEWHIARREAGEQANFQAVRSIAVTPGESEVRFLNGTVQLADDTVDNGRWEKNPAWFLCTPKWCAHHAGAGGPCDPDVPASDDPVYPVA